MKINESVLYQKSICSLMSLPDDTAIYSTSVEVLRWCLLSSWNKVIPKLEDIRARFIYHWNDKWGKKEKQGQLYWKGPKASIGISFRLYKFLLEYTCVRPLEPYDLTFLSDSILGWVAIVKNNSNKKSYALDIVETKPIYYEPIPDYRSLARWLYIRDTYDKPELGLLHLPLVNGTFWKDEEIKEALAKDWVGAIIKQIVNKIAYPRMGPQCTNCSKPCKEVLTCG